MEENQRSFIFLSLRMMLEIVSLRKHNSFLKFRKGNTTIRKVKNLTNVVPIHLIRLPNNQCREVNWHIHVYSIYSEDSLE